MTRPSLNLRSLPVYREVIPASETEQMLFAQLWTGLGLQQQASEAQSESRRQVASPSMQEAG
jgi:hypothetical protein